MVAVFFLISLLLASTPLPLWATPVPGQSPRAGTLQTRGAIADLLSLLCQIKPLNKLFCPSKGPSSVTLSTPLGPATGVADSSANTVGRFVVRYATANRWQTSTMVTKWQLPNGSSDPSALPLACPQEPTQENSANTSEDCLSMILYIPSSAANGKIPALMWIHGGSNVVGSATGPGLNGAKLAQASNSIVAVIQYRLGAFGFLSPSGQSNLAVKDVIVAMQFLQKVLPSFNGDTSKVTIAGQSSGASMVRALLAAPSASSLFKSAILHSDPMDYGFLSPGAFQTVNNYFKEQTSCTNTNCFNGLSAAAILDASTSTQQNAQFVDASAGNFVPMRPVHDGSLITSPLDITAPFPRQSKTIIVSTVQNEAGPAIFNGIGDPLPESALEMVVNITMGTDRTNKLLASPFYQLPAGADADTFDARLQIISMGTDQIWRCPSWTFARSWAAAGGKVYVGEYIIGATYPDNEDISFCTQGGTVCHEDDIQIAFGTCSSPNNKQSSLITEIQARYKSFLSGGNPNAAGFQNWPTVSGSNTNAILLGASGAAPINACTPDFWGNQVSFDYQIFGQ